MVDVVEVVAVVAIVTLSAPTAVTLPLSGERLTSRSRSIAYAFSSIPCANSNTRWPIGVSLQALGWRSIKRFLTSLSSALKRRLTVA